MPKVAKKASAVWKVFEEAGNDKVRCKLCDSTLSYKGGSTGSMSNHIKSRHPGSLDRDDNRHQVQPRMTDFARGCDPSRRQRLSSLIAEMIAVDGIPVSFVEGDGFRKLFNHVEPNFTIPTRKTIMGMIETKFETMKEDVRVELRRGESLALTTDCWTSLGQEGYMTVTAHVINENWQKSSFVLETLPVASMEDDDLADEDDIAAATRMPQRHTADALKSQLLRVCEEWEIRDKITAVVHDNARNVRYIGTVVEADDVPCAAHTLQLCVNAGLASSNTLKTLIGACSRLVGFFKHSVIASKSLTAKQVHHNLPQHKLVQSVKTRWNSTYDMFVRLNEQRWAVTSVLSDVRCIPRRDAQTYELRDDQWSAVDMMTKCLRPLQLATTVLSSEKNTTMSSVLPIINGLVNHHMAVKENDPPIVRQFKETTVRQLKDRFQSTSAGEEQQITAMEVASALDPRHRGMTFFPQETRDGIKQIIRQLLPEPIDADREDDDCTPNNSLDFLITGEERQQPMQRNDVDELDEYFRTGPASSVTNPIEWWSDHKREFPRLSKVARRFMTVPATSVPSERVFSTAGRIANKKRTCLLPENLNMLVFISHNAKMCKVAS